MENEKKNLASAVLHEHRHTVSTESQPNYKSKTRKELKKEALKKAELTRPHQLTMTHLAGKRHERVARANLAAVTELEQQLAGRKLLLIVRVKSIAGISPYLCKLLTALGLTESSCTFLQVNYESIKLVAALKGLIAFGAPAESTVRDLLNTRGMMLVEGGQKVKVDNLLIEEYLGKLGLVCVEDCVAQIMYRGEHFAAVMGMYKGFLLQYQKWDKGGAEKCGYIGEQINRFVASLM